MLEGDLLLATFGLGVVLPTLAFFGLGVSAGSGCSEVRFFAFWSFCEFVTGDLARFGESELWAPDLGDFGGADSESDATGLEDADTGGCGDECVVASPVFCAFFSWRAFLSFSAAALSVAGRVGTAVYMGRATELAVLMLI